MSTGRPPPGTIPTLTEVVAWPDAVEAVDETPAVQSLLIAPIAPIAPVALPIPAPAPAPVAAAPEPVRAVAPVAPVAPVPPSVPLQVAVPAPVPATPAATQASPAAARPAPASPADVQLTQRVLADLQRQVELMLEVRLREALAPILARASDALVRDARKELTAAMRDIVSRSIARELGKREDR